MSPVLLILATMNLLIIVIAVATGFPWMEQKICAAQELIDEIGELSESERTILKRSILDLTQDSPKMEVASVRYKKLLHKASRSIGQSLNSIVTSTSTETAKKMLGL